jgi:deoxycytidylate deaminase
MFERYVEITKALMADHFTAKTFHTTFIVRKNRLQKIGINNGKTHPENLKYNYYSKDGTDIRSFVGVHSELSAILKYGEENCNDCVFVNVRINKNGELTMSKPCAGCQDLLKQVGYKKVYYSNEKGNFVLWDGK